MNNYELTIVIDGKATTAKKKTITDKLEKSITALKGKVGKVRDMGTRDLAYKIKKSETGAFLVYPLELSGEGAKSVNDKLRLEEDIIRYLLISID